MMKELLNKLFEAWEDQFEPMGDDEEQRLKKEKIARGLELIGYLVNDDGYEYDTTLLDLDDWERSGETRELADELIGTLYEVLHAMSREQVQEIYLKDYFWMDRQAMQEEIARNINLIELEKLLKNV